MKLFLLFCFSLPAISFLHAQSPRKQLPAIRTNANFKIDGDLSEAPWSETIPAKDFIELRPNNGRPERYENRTEIYILYDNTSVYIGGYCHEEKVDSVSKELAGRDGIGVSDYVGVALDTYNDKINAVGFYTTPYGEQYDAKYSVSTNSNNGGEDATWNAVWQSAAKMQHDGWTFEIKIPYSALRFNNKENQTWGLNIIRFRSKAGQQLSWNPINTLVNGFINQEGEWVGIQRIAPPVRLSLTPYFSAYLNHYPYHNPAINDFSSSINGGMDVKYGINESFTLDMTLVPDFGQVQSDNKVLNLSPFEVKYNENRSFFTEGTELFNKGNLFYSRRIGGTPLHYSDLIYDTSEHIIRNPTATKLINATKISGRTSKGLGIGFFNAVTNTTFAIVADNSGKTRRIETDPLSNYNIIVLDQNLKNNSSVSLINTSVIRTGKDYSADVAAALFNLNDKKNMYNINGKFAVSNLFYFKGPNTSGYSHRIDMGKTSGHFNFELSQDLADDKYNPNDMGILFNNNYLNHYAYFGFHWNKPGSWYNRLNYNNNFNYNRLFTPSSFENFNYNFNVNGQFKNLMFFLLYFTYTTPGNDFFEPHETGRVYQSPASFLINAFVNSNQAKKYSYSLGLYFGKTYLFKGRYYDINFNNLYRFSDKFSLDQSTDINPLIDNVGFADIQKNDVLFARRNRLTVENILHAKYNFNNKSGVTFRARHYWSKVPYNRFANVTTTGDYAYTTSFTKADENVNYFNIDAFFTWDFKLGCRIILGYKNWLGNDEYLDPSANKTYFRNFS
ncbi:MAG: DUF5916 domain-containing protein, partial [Flavisolibacter sp.]